MTSRSVYSRVTANVMTSNSFRGRVDVIVSNSCWGLMLGEEGQAKRRGPGRLITGRNC